MTRLVVFAFWSVVLLGLPFWWKTTEVYRANLPFSEIDAWQNKQVTLVQQRERKRHVINNKYRHVISSCQLNSPFIYQLLLQ